MKDSQSAQQVKYHQSQTSNERRRFTEGFAVLIGVGQTPHAPVYSLPVAAINARELYRTLIDPEASGYVKEHVSCLYNENAGLDGIRAAMNWLATRTCREDIIVFYFSGRVWKAQGVTERYCLVPADMKLSDLKNSVLWESDLVEMLGAATLGHLVVVIDPCSMKVPDRDENNPEKVQPPSGFVEASLPEGWLDTTILRPGQVVINAASEGRPSYYKTWPPFTTEVPSPIEMGILTYHLNNALRESADPSGRGLCEILHVINYLKAAVGTTARQWGIDQDPWATGARPNFPIALLPTRNASESDARRASILPRDKPPYPHRILVVDDEDDIRQTFMDSLQSLGYDPVAARGRGSVLQENALKLAKDKRCHLALVDMQIRGAGSGDTDGKSLIAPLKPARSIIVSGTGRTDARTMSDATKLGAVDYFQKGQERSESEHETARYRSLGDTIKENIEKFWNCDLQFSLEGTGYTAEKILELLLDEPEDDTNWQEVPIDEINIALRELYRHEENFSPAQVTLDHIESIDNFSGSDPLRRRSVVLRSQIFDRRGSLLCREIIKFAPIERIKREAANYDKHVENGLLHRHTARIQEPKSFSWDIGALRYSDEGDGRERFDVWYTKNTAKSVAQAVNNLFTTALRPWYVRDAQRQLGNIFDYYTEPSVLDKFMKRLDVFIEEHKSRTNWPILVAGQDLALPNPVLWSHRNRQNAEFSSRWKTIIHGDLHSGNIFVDSTKKPCIIDYERTGEGHILRDFVELESDIRFHLLGLSENQLDLALFLDCLLLKQEYPNKPAKWETPPVGMTDTHTTEDIRKAFVAIRAVRKAFNDIYAEPISRTDADRRDLMKEYYWTLLMENLYSLTKTYSKLRSKVSDAQTTRSLRAAYQRSELTTALICERLEHWNDSRRIWPPNECRIALLPPNARKVVSVASPGPTPAKLKLQLTDLRNDQQTFKVRVLESSPIAPIGTPQATSRLPYDQNELTAVLKVLELGMYQEGAFSKIQSDSLCKLDLLTNGTLAADYLERIGHDLYRSLVLGDPGISACFVNNFHQEPQEGTLQLSFDTDAVALACYPWELLHDGYPDLRRSLVEVTRYIAYGRAESELPVQGKCHLVYVGARPSGSPSLPIGPERTAIRNSLSFTADGSSRFEFEEIQPTLDALRRRLSDPTKPEVHVIHFDGHGLFASRCGTCQRLYFPHETTCSTCNKSLDKPTGYLVFEKADGSADYVDTKKLLDRVQGNKLRLAVLSACQSAQVRRAEALLSGVGPGLILAGIPAVVAMQFPIPVDEAVRFTEAFYTAIVQKQRLSDAMFRARQALSQDNIRSSPVLYLRSQGNADQLCVP